MDRRGFLKRCGLLPFISSLATVAHAEAKQEYFEGHPVRSVQSGQVFEAPWPLCHTVIVQYFGSGDKWMLLSGPYSAAQHGGNAMMVYYYKRKDGSYSPFYTQRELQEKLKDWKLIEDKRLVFARVLKIR